MERTECTEKLEIEMSDMSKSISGCSFSNPTASGFRSLVHSLEALHHFLHTDQAAGKLRHCAAKLGYILCTKGLEMLKSHLKIPYCCHLVGHFLPQSLLSRLRRLFQNLSSLFTQALPPSQAFVNLCHHSTIQARNT